MNPRFRADLAGVRMVSGVSAREMLAILFSCCGVPRRRNSVLDRLRANKFGDIQFGNSIEGGS